jgi:purine-binding chemotaxis protein CheW
VFSLHGEDYAVPLANVREIIRYSEPKATTAAQGLVQGMISLRGQVVPVADLSSVLARSPEVDAHSRIVVLELSKGALGLIVGGVQGVMRVAEELIQPLPMRVIAPGVGEQVAAVGDRLIMLIDPDRALGKALVTRATRQRRKVTD